MVGDPHNELFAGAGGLTADHGSPGARVSPACSDCGSVVAERSACPNCGKVFCQPCAEKPYAFCCMDEETMP